MDRDLPTGIRRLKKSYQAYFDYQGHQYSQTFPFTTPLLTMKAWRERTLANLKYGTPAEPVRTFTEDADDYLQMVTAMPSYVDRKFHIDQWTLVFGPRDRRTLTATDIRLQLESWRSSGRWDGKGLKAGSLNRRRTALMAMFTALDGRSQPNVVKDVPAYDERASHQVRAQSMLTMARIIRQTRRWGASRARLHVLMWTGWPSALLKSVTAEDVDWTRSLVRLARRQKGKGLASMWVPVLPKALAGLRRMKALDAWGAFSNSALHSAWVRACDAADVKRCRVYDLRHAFATWAAARMKDDRALSELLRTRSIARYTDGATSDRLRSALQDLQATRRTEKDSKGKPHATRESRSGRNTHGTTRKTA